MAEVDKAREFEVKLKNVRLSFAHIFRAQPGQVQDDGTRGPDKFNCAFLMSKTEAEGKENAKAMSAAIKACGDAKWGAGKWNLKPEKKALRDGDLESYDGYEGMYYCSASNTRKPKVFDRRKQEVTEDSGIVYSGCYVNAIVRIWAQDNKHGKRINASLEGIQFVRDGEAFGAAPLSDDAFDALDDADGLTDDEDGLL